MGSHDLQNLLLSKQFYLLQTNDYIGGQNKI